MHHAVVRSSAARRLAASLVTAGGSDRTLLAQRVDLRRRIPQLRVNLSTFVPKAHTPFQWVARESEERLSARQELLRQAVRRKAIKLSWPDAQVSRLEAALSRGDRRLGQVIYRAWKMGALFDSWGEHFNYLIWQHAFEECGIDPDFYAQRARDLDEPLPWDHIDIGVATSFLKEEYRRAVAGEETVDCRDEGCNVCGLQGRDPACREKAAGLRSASHRP